MLVINMYFRELFIALLQFNVLSAFKFLSGYLTLGMSNCGVELGREEMGTGLCLHGLH